MEASKCIIVAHQPMDSISEDYELVQTHFKRHGIEAGLLGQDETRLVWRRKTAKEITKAIRQSGLDATVANQKPWCDADAASEIAKLLEDK